MAINNMNKGVERGATGNYLTLLNKLLLEKPLSLSW